MSVNVAWQGRRFKTVAYKDYEKLIIYLLPSLKVPKSRFGLKLRFGLSSKNSDIDNPIKPLLDILQKRYGINDKMIYRLEVEKVDVSKGKDFIEIEFKKL